VSLVAMITFSFVEDPFGLLFRGCLICTMVGQMVAGIASTALAAAKAPESMRGSVTGVFRAAGAVGMLSFTIIGGIMFDAHGPAAPFLVLSFVNLFVGVAAVVLHVRTHAPRVAAPAMA
jgi:MFS family permease